MNRMYFPYWRKIFTILLFGSLAFFYLEQRMVLIELSYCRAKLNKSVRQTLLKKEELTYKIAHLENPALLEKKMTVFNPKFNFAKTIRVVKIPYYKTPVKEQPLAGGSVSYAGELP